MKILHVIGYFSPKYGGPPKACLEMACAQAELGKEVFIFTTNMDSHGTLDVPLDNPVYVKGAILRYFPIQYPKFWGTSFPMARALREIIQKVEIVHIHVPYLFHAAMAAMYCCEFGVPYVFQPHGAFDPYIYNRHRYRKWIVEKLYQNKINRRASCILYNTEEEKRLAEQYTFGTPGVVVPIGLNYEDYDDKKYTEILSKRFPELKGKKIILFLGRINYKKGLNILVKAFSFIAKKYNDVHLLIAGPDDDGYGEKVVRWLKEEGVIANATLAGMLQGEEKLEAFYKSKVFVLPSYSENFGISVLEAMACGLPVAISNKVNIWDDVLKANAGLVSACDVEGFTKIIKCILDDEPYSRQMGINGKSLVKNKYSWREIAGKLISVYATILNKS